MKSYEEPIMEIIQLNEEDIIRTSGLTGKEDGAGDDVDFGDLF